MGVPTSEVGYTSATARSGDHKSSYEHAVALEEKMATTTHPDVNLGPCVLLPFEDLRCGVWWRPTPRGQLLARRVVVAEPEVCNLDVHVAVHQQVLGLQA